MNKSSVRDWIRLYNQKGSLGLLHTENNRSYPPQLKGNAVEAHLAGEGRHKV